VVILQIASACALVFGFGEEVPRSGTQHHPREVQHQLPKRNTATTINSDLFRVVALIFWWWSTPPLVGGG
jgi:hypothetical protein